MPTAKEIIEHFKLEPLPDEGGWFRQTYKSPYVHKHLECYEEDKPAGTAIYYLLEDKPNSFSAMHKLLTEEIWHFYLGDPVEMLLLNPNDGTHNQVLLGQGIFDEPPQHVQFEVPVGMWQGARVVPGGEHGFAFMGTTMAPGYTPKDFTLGKRAALVQQFPQATTMIEQLTRLPEEASDTANG